MVKMIVDFHTHILPKLDDGSSSVDESLKMLEMLKADGVTDVVLTPHFYIHNQNMESFLDKRERAFSTLRSVCPEGMTLHIGAEAEFADMAINYSAFEQLAIDNGRFILIELPFTSEFTDKTVQRIGRFVDNTGLVPIIAHVERYPAIIRRPRLIAELESIGCLIQINADSVTDSKKGSLADALLRTGQAHLLGTDCHNLEARKPQYKKAIETIVGRYGQACADYIAFNAEKVIKGESPVTDRIEIIRKRFGKYI